MATVLLEVLADVVSGCFWGPFVVRRVGTVWMGFPHTLFFTSTFV